MFEGLDSRSAASLLTTMPAGAFRARTGFGPSLGNVLTSAVNHPGAVEIHGHVVGPESSYEQIAPEGVLIYDDDLEDERDVLYAARDKYGITDAVRQPQYVDRVTSPWRTDADGKPLSAWRLTWTA